MKLSFAINVNELAPRDANIYYGGRAIMPGVVIKSNDCRAGCRSN
jgi:hypothetical protein